MSCTFENIKAAMLPVAKVSTPEWGGDGHVFVRSLRGAELTALKKVFVSKKSKDDESWQNAATVALCLCDDHGKRICDDSDATVEVLLLGPLAPLKRCANAFLEHNALTDDAVEDAEKN